jgi:hypothetical protein
MYKNTDIFVEYYDEHDWEELFKSDPWRENLSEEDWNLLPDDREVQREEMRCN